MFNMLYDRISVYDTGDYPVLAGEKLKYSEFIKEDRIEEKSKEVSKVFDEISKYFQRAIKWEHSGCMLNITPPANLASIATALYSLLYNPNCSQDEPTGYMLAMELAVVRMMAKLAGWKPDNSSGIFTFGGKGTNLYAVKMAINKINSKCKTDGVKVDDFFVVSSEKAHPCHKEICDWLGLGKNSHITIPVASDGRMNMEILENILRDKIEAGKKLACIMLSGGTTNENLVDPIKEVYDLRQKLVEEYNLNYMPHIHVDAVIGWAWLFYSKYDFENNRLNIPTGTKKKIQRMYNRIKDIKYSDSYGADFHKTGYCPYVSSILMVSDRTCLQGLGDKDREYSTLKCGEYSPFEYSLELTRSSIGPVAAFTALRLFGYEGYQEILYKVFYEGEFIREVLNQQKDFCVLNNATEGFASLFIALPKSLDGMEITNELLMEKAEFIQDYNHRFFLYLNESLENRKVNFKISFSKSFKLFGMEKYIGALKAYQTSPIADLDEVRKCLECLIVLKEEFDIYKPLVEDDINRPIDFVYR